MAGVTEAEIPEAEIVAGIRRRLFDDDEHQLIAVYLYGSAARGELRKDSDIDVAFLGRSSPPALEVIYTASELMGLVRREVDLVDLRKAPTVLRSQVVSLGRRIYTGSRFEAECFEMYTYSDYAWLQDLRKDVVEAFLARYRHA